MLPEAFASDPERLSRFTREAQTLASLNHPNIAAIYGIEETLSTSGSGSGLRALVMELVEGADLSTHIARGPIPIAEALPIARQIAEALEAAHEHGIIHRDLKPANIKLRTDGTVKVLDFGLAKAFDSDGGAANSQISHSPTMSRHATEAGLILGTAAYMSPEQARGKPVDKRADIWSFGVVLFEMLSGTRLFAGETVSDTLAAVLREEVPWPALPPPTPRGVVQLLRRCLTRDPRHRLRDIGEARFALASAETPEEPDSSQSGMPGTTAAGLARRRLLPTAIVLVATLLAVGFLVYRTLQTGPPAVSGLTWVSILPPPDGFKEDVDPAVSPDGRTLAFVAPGASGTALLWLRDFASPLPRAIPGSEGARMPFWSPDGRWIGFFAQAKMKKTPVSGGSPEILADVSNARGGTRSSQGDILFTSTSVVTGQRTTAEGGPGPPLTLPGDAAGRPGERRSDPHFLPDGRHFLFTRGSSILVGALDSTEVKEVAPLASKAEYARGHLFFVRGGDLFRAVLRCQSSGARGAPVKVADNIGFNGNTIAGFSFSVSASGVVAYWDRNSTVATELTWLDRAGNKLGGLGEPGEYSGLALSPDGRHVAVELGEPKSSRISVWLIDVGSGARSRFNTYKDRSGVPLWSADSKRLLVTDFIDRQLLLILPIEGGPPQEIKVGGGAKWPTDWSRDGRFIVFAENNETFDIGMVGTDGGAPVPYLHTPFNEGAGIISPDGSWLAYRSEETGSSEVYVQAFPKAGRKLRISTTGGDNPIWRPDGRALFYLARDGGLVEVELTPRVGGGLEVRSARTLFHPANRGGRLNNSRRIYAVTSDGRRFLFMGIVPDTSPRAITMILNWAPGAK